MYRCKLKKYGKSNDYIKIIKKRKITSYVMEGKTWNEVNNENIKEKKECIKKWKLSRERSKKPSTLSSSIGQDSAA